MSYATFSTTVHIEHTLAVANQRLYLLQQLKCQGLSCRALHIIFTAIVLSVVTYALPAFSGQLSSGDKDWLDGLFRKAFKRGLCTDVFRIDDFMHHAWSWYEIIPSGIRSESLSVPTPAPQKTQKTPLLPQKSWTQLHIATHWIITLQKLLHKQMFVYYAVNCFILHLYFTLYWHFVVFLCLCLCTFYCKSLCDCHAINKCNSLTYFKRLLDLTWH